MAGYEKMVNGGRGGGGVPPVGTSPSQGSQLDAFSMGQAGSHSAPVARTLVYDTYSPMTTGGASSMASTTTTASVAAVGSAPGASSSMAQTVSGAGVGPGGAGVGGGVGSNGMAGVDIYAMTAAVQAAVARFFPGGVPPNIDAYSVAAAQAAASLALQAQQQQQQQQMQQQHSQQTAQQHQQQQAAAAAVAAAVAAAAAAASGGSMGQSAAGMGQRGVPTQQMVMPMQAGVGYDLASMVQVQQHLAAQQRAVALAHAQQAAQVRLQQQLAAATAAEEELMRQQKMRLLHQHQANPFLHGHSPKRASGVTTAAAALRVGSPPTLLPTHYAPHSPPPFQKGAGGGRGGLAVGLSGLHNMSSSLDSGSWGGPGSGPQSPLGERPGAHGGGSGPCRFYAQGQCSRGENCPFGHTPSQGERSYVRSLSERTLKDLRRSSLPLMRDERPERVEKLRRSPRGSSGGAGVVGGSPMGSAEKAGSANGAGRDRERERERERDGSSRRGGKAGEANGSMANGHSVVPNGGRGTQSTERASSRVSRSGSLRGGEDTVDHDSTDTGSTRSGRSSPPGSVSERDRMASKENPLTSSPPPGQSAPKYTTLEEVEGRIFSIAKDQHGCRFLQRKFDEGGPEEVAKIFAEIVEHVIDLMTDPFGNYLIQKLLEVCDGDQLAAILAQVTAQDELVHVSLNMHGTRAVQKLVETLANPEQPPTEERRVQIQMVIAALKPGVVTLIKDLNGNHVVQRCLQRLSNNDNQFIFDAAAENCVGIATHRHGCCVLQRCVDHAAGAQRDRLVAEIASNALVLSQDPFGNYVVQYVLDLGLTWVNEEVMVRLEGNYPHLAMQKFSSNVVEKCLKLAGEDMRHRIVRELVVSSRLAQLLQDPYANYVMQSSLALSKGVLHTELVEAIKPHLPTLRSSPYGKRILSRTNLKK